MKICRSLRGCCQEPLDLGALRTTARPGGETSQVRRAIVSRLSAKHLLHPRENNGLEGGREPIQHLVLQKRRLRSGMKATSTVLTYCGLSNFVSTIRLIRTVQASNASKLRHNSSALVIIWTFWSDATAAYFLERATMRDGSLGPLYASGNVMRLVLALSSSMKPRSAVSKSGKLSILGMTLR